MPRYEKDTDTLLNEIRDSKEPADIEGFLARNVGELVRPLHEYLGDLLRERHLEKQDVIRRSRLERSYAYHIFSGDRPNPSRPKLLAIALAMGLGLPEVQYLLRYAGHGILYPRSPWDSVIITAIEQGMSVDEANALLEQLGSRQLVG